MRLDIEIDDAEFKRSVDRHAERVLRPAMAEVVDALAANAVKRLRAAAEAASRAPNPLTSGAIVRTLADASEVDPSALVYVRDDDLPAYELAVFGGVAHDVVMPAHQSEFDERSGFGPDYVHEVERRPKSAWVVSHAGDRFLIDKDENGNTRFIAVLLPELLVEPTLDFFGTVEKSVATDLALDPGLDLG